MAPDSTASLSQGGTPGSAPWEGAFPAGATPDGTSPANLRTTRGSPHARRTSVSGGEFAGSMARAGSPPPATLVGAPERKDSARAGDVARGRSATSGPGAAPQPRRSPRRPPEGAAGQECRPWPADLWRSTRMIRRPTADRGGRAPASGSERAIVAEEAGAGAAPVAEAGADAVAGGVAGAGPVTGAGADAAAGAMAGAVAIAGAAAVAEAFAGACAVAEAAAGAVAVAGARAGAVAGAGAAARGGPGPIPSGVGDAKAVAGPGGVARATTSDPSVRAGAGRRVAGGGRIAPAEGAAPGAFRPLTSITPASMASSTPGRISVEGLRRTDGALPTSSTAEGGRAASLRTTPGSPDVRRAPAAGVECAGGLAGAAPWGPATPAGAPEGRARARPTGVARGSPATRGPGATAQLWPCSAPRAPEFRPPRSGTS